jgi:3-hydroxyacyl-[acyl-carrier-protein] dehydratase
MKNIKECKNMLNNIEIQKIIPHRYPFLLVDKIVEMEPGKKAVGIKNVTANEPFFQGHFPGNPIMPGVLIIEALAQVGAVAVLSMEEYKGKLALFTGIENAKFRRQVVPGDTLRLEVEMSAMRRGMGKGEAVAFVGDEVACKAIIKFAVVDKE